MREEIAPGTTRLEVYKGWLIETQVGATFVPDEKHEWALATKPAPIPAPEIPPVVVTPPQPPVAVLLPSVITNMEKRGELYVSKPAWVKSLAALQFNLPKTPHGGHLRITAKRRGKYPSDLVNHNWKIWRGWANAVGNQNNNFYIGQAPGLNRLAFCEFIGDDKTTKKSIPSLTFPNETFREEVLDIQFNTEPGKPNGSWSLTINGEIRCSSGAWRFNSVDRPALPNIWLLQEDPSNFTVPDDSFVEYSDVVVEHSW